MSPVRTVIFCFIYWYHWTFIRNSVPIFFKLYLFNAQLVPCLLTRVIVTRVRGKIMHIFTLLACSIFGDPAVPDPPSVENRVGVHLILLYFIRILVVGTEIIFLFWCGCGCGCWWRTFFVFKSLNKNMVYTSGLDVYVCKRNRCTTKVLWV